MEKLYYVLVHGSPGCQVGHATKEIAEREALRLFAAHGGARAVSILKTRKVFPAKAEMPAPDGPYERVPIVRYKRKRAAPTDQQSSAAA